MSKTGAATIKIRTEAATKTPLTPTYTSTVSCVIRFTREATKSKWSAQKREPIYTTHTQHRLKIWKALAKAIWLINFWRMWSGPAVGEVFHRELLVAPAARACNSNELTSERLRVWLLVLEECTSVHTRGGSSSLGDKINKRWWWWFACMWSLLCCDNREKVCVCVREQRWRSHAPTYIHACVFSLAPWVWCEDNLLKSNSFY